MSGWLFTRALPTCFSQVAPPSSCWDEGLPGVPFPAGAGRAGRAAAGCRACFGLGAGTFRNGAPPPRGLPAAYEAPRPQPTHANGRAPSGASGRPPPRRPPPRPGTRIRRSPAQPAGPPCAPSSVDCRAMSPPRTWRLANARGDSASIEHSSATPPALPTEPGQDPPTLNCAPGKKIVSRTLGKAHSEWPDDLP